MLGPETDDLTHAVAPAIAEGGELAVGPLVMSPDGRAVTWHGQAVGLTPREFRVLETLVRNRERIISRRQLEQILYGLDETIDSNAVEVHIHHLRRKLARGVIQTVRGAGYRIRLEAGVG
ncbi:MAG TPA: response regulator transcription factor [Burkholderiaceae bacterium]|nr:response regulator transcription factor [Burkholderiaceae bacterium]